MTYKVLIVAKTANWLEGFIKQIDTKNIEIFGGINLDDVRRIFEQESIDLLFMGPHYPGDDRLQIIEHVYSVSKSTSVHMKSNEADPVSFVNSIIKALVD